MTHLHLQGYHACHTCVSVIDCASANVWCDTSSLMSLPGSFGVRHYRPAFFLTSNASPSSHFTERHLRVIALASVRIFPSYIMVSTQLAFVPPSFLTLPDFGRISLEILISVAFLSRFFSLVALSSTSVALSFMFADNRRCDRDWSDDHPVRSRDTSIDLSRQERVANGGDANDADFYDGSALFLFKPRPSGDATPAPVRVTKYINIFRLLLNARQLAAMH